MQTDLDVKARDKATRKDTWFIYPMCMFFFIVFTIGSLFAGWFSIIEPWLRWHHAQSWEAVPCQITTSKIGVSASIGKGVTYPSYTAHIQYSFDWQGIERKSETVTIRGFQTKSSTDQAKCEQLIASYPLNASTTCFVNPLAPDQSALDLSFQTWDYLTGFGICGALLLSGLLFFLIGRKCA